MIPEDFFIDIIGTGAIETLGKLMYYQNITWPEKLPNTGIVADINENKASFDVNKKISDIMNKYLS